MNEIKNKKNYLIKNGRQQRLRLENQPFTWLQRWMDLLYQLQKLSILRINK